MSWSEKNIFFYWDRLFLFFTFSFCIFDNIYNSYNWLNCSILLFLQSQITVRLQNDKNNIKRNLFLFMKKMNLFSHMSSDFLDENILLRFSFLKNMFLFSLALGTYLQILLCPKYFYYYLIFLFCFRLVIILPYVVIFEKNDSLRFGFLT